MKQFICPKCKSVMNAEDDKKFTFCMKCGTKIFESNSYLKFINDKERCLEKLEEEPNDYNALYSLCLLDYGFKFDNIKNTCVKVNFNSIYNNKYYLKLKEILNSNYYSRFEEIVKFIDETQNKYKELLNDLIPFDIYLCYEKNNNVRKYEDLELADKIYNDLSKNGYNVFMEDFVINKNNIDIKDFIIDKAMNEAKVMIFVASGKVSVSSESCKELITKFIEISKDKKVLTCFKDVLGFDYPDYLINFPTFDLNNPKSKQELNDTIDKLFNYSININSPLFKEGKYSKSDLIIKMLNINLKLNNYKIVDNLSDKLIELDEKNPYAYLYKIVAQEKMSSIDEVFNSFKIDSELFNKVSQYAYGELREKVELYYAQKEYSEIKAKAIYHAKRCEEQLAKRFVNDSTLSDDKKQELISEIELLSRSIYLENVRKEFENVLNDTIFNTYKFEELCKKYSDSNDENVKVICKEYIEKSKQIIDKVNKSKQLLIENKKKRNIIIIAGVSIILVFVLLMFLFI